MNALITLLTITTPAGVIAWFFIALWVGAYPKQFDEDLRRGSLGSWLMILCAVGWIGLLVATITYAALNTPPALK